MRTVTFDHNPSQQDIMDAIFIRARDGRGKCLNKDYHCAYESEGNRCFIGIFLDPEIFGEALGNLNDLMMSKKYRDHVPKWMYEHEEFLHALQSLHDGIDLYLPIKCTLECETAVNESALRSFCRIWDLIYRERSS